jgi:hypothetical protein
MRNKGLKLHHRGLLFCAASLAIGAGACADDADSSDVDALAAVDGPAVVGAKRDEDPSASGSLGGPAIVDVDRDEDPSASGSHGGPSVGSVTRDENPSASGSHGGPSIGSVTRTVIPTGADSGGGPRIIDVDRNNDPSGKPGSISVTREPVVPGRPAVPGTAPGGPTISPPRLDGPFYASVVANGTGCPAGTWNTALSDDGQTFTTTFSAYSAFVSPSQAISIKDCLLAIKLHSTEQLQYAVQAFRFAGYAYLEDGASAVQTAKYYIQGNPANSIDAKSELTGPFNSTYTLQNEVELGREIWSPCGKERDINIETRIRLRNGDPAGTAYVNLAAVTGSAKAIIRVSRRRCSPSNVQPTAPTDGPTVTPRPREPEPAAPAPTDGPTVTPRPREPEPAAPAAPPSGSGIAIERS